MNITVREATDHDRLGIRRVQIAAFDGQVEADLVDALVDGGYCLVSLVALHDGKTVGHVLFSDLKIIGPQDGLRAAALAPVAVLPEYQRQGIGSELIRQGLELCGEKDIDFVFVLGHPAYYPRFGFTAALAARFDSPYAGEAFMAVQLSPGAAEAVSGELRYAPPFEQLDGDGQVR